MTLDFENLSQSQAFAFRDHVVAREDARLGDLARLMVSTDGPVDIMDASVDSLVPLWVWFAGFAARGFPGVPSNAWSSPALAFRRNEGLAEGVGRQYYAVETLEHYVLKVVQRVDPTAHWDTYVQTGTRVIHADHHFTGIRFSDDQFRRIDNRLARVVRKVLAGDAAARDRSCLKDLVLGTFGWVVRPPVQSPAPSILSPMVASTPVPLDDPRRQPPVFELDSPVDVEPADPTFGEELLFAAIGTVPERPESAPALDAKVIATALSEMGFRTRKGSTISAVDLTVSENEQFELGEVALVETCAIAGRLTGFLLQPIAATEGEWAAVVASLNSLGLMIGARLAPEGDFLWEKDT